MQCTCAMLSSVACPALHHFSTLSRKRNDLKKKFEHKMCASIFSTTYGWRIFHSKNNWLRYNQNNKLVFMNSACCYFDIVMEIEFTWQFFWKILLSYLMKLHQVAAELFRADGRTYWWTDMMDLMVAFHYFPNVPNVENLGWYDIYFVNCNWVDTWWQQ